MDWLMIGSAPSVIDTLPIVREQLDKVAALQKRPYRTITTNAGIKLWPVPDYFVICDMGAGPRFETEARVAQSQGTTLITLQRDQRALVERKVDWYCQFLVLGQEPTRTNYGCFKYSGPLCLEYACHHGASTIHLVGFDGYRCDFDYFDPDDPVRHRKRLSRPRDESHNPELQKRCQHLAAVWHDVQFIQYGNPVFSVGTDNWEVRQSVAI